MRHSNLAKLSLKGPPFEDNMSYDSTIKRPPQRGGSCCLKRVNAGGNKILIDPAKPKILIITHSGGGRGIAHKGSFITKAYTPTF
jgi:hypothetical protein